MKTLKTIFFFILLQTQVIGQYPSSNPSNIAVSLNSRYLYATNFEGILVYDNIKRSLLNKIPCGLGEITLSSDGKYLAFFNKYQLTLYNAGTYEKIYDLPKAQNALQSVIFSPDCKYIVDVGIGYVNIWNINKQKIHFKLNHSISSQSNTLLCAISKDNKYIVTCNRKEPNREHEGPKMEDYNQGTLIRWDFNLGSPIDTLQFKIQNFICLLFDNNNKIIGVSFNKNNNDSVKFWDIKQNMEILSPQLFSQCYTKYPTNRSFGFSPDGKYFINLLTSYPSDQTPLGSINIFDNNSGRKIGIINSYQWGTEFSYFYVDLDNYIYFRTVQGLFNIFNKSINEIISTYKNN